MEFNNNDAAVSTDSTDQQPSDASPGEIDLYDDLVAFAGLSPEEQLRLADAQTRASTETQIASSENAASVFSSEPVAQTSSDQIEVETWAEELEQQSAAEAAEQHSSEAEAPREAEEIESVEIGTPFVAEAVEGASPEAVAAPASIEPVETQSTEQTEESAGREFHAHNLIESAEPATPVALVASPPGFEPSSLSVERGEAPATNSGPRPSGPLSGFNLPQNIVYTGALSRGVCLACGADSGADDLFCITCGVFINEIGSTLPVNPTCPECKNGIATDEIFCPWCGSVMPAA